MSINKDTKIFCSFSSNPGNNGCNFFNKKFKENKVNAIYKSFYSDNIEASVNAVKTLDIKGFAVSMPFKKEILNHVNEVSNEVLYIGAANTITNKDGYLKAYNTDYLGVLKYLKTYIELNRVSRLAILGNGGFSKAVQYVCVLLDLPFKIVERKDWDIVNNLEGAVFNCTPIEVKVKGSLIDARPYTLVGKEIAKFQAEQQFKIYMND